MIEAQLTDGATKNGVSKNVETRIEKKTTKKLKHKKKRKNVDLGSTETRDQSTKRNSEIYDVKLRHRQNGKERSRYINDHFCFDLF